MTFCYEVTNAPLGLPSRKISVEPPRVKTVSKLHNIMGIGARQC